MLPTEYFELRVFKHCSLVQSASMGIFWVHLKTTFEDYSAYFRHQDSLHTGSLRVKCAVNACFHNSCSITSIGSQETIKVKEVSEALPRPVGCLRSVCVWGGDLRQADLAQWRMVGGSSGRGHALPEYFCKKGIQWCNFLHFSMFC